MEDLGPAKGDVNLEYCVQECVFSILYIEELVSTYNHRTRRTEMDLDD